MQLTNKPESRIEKNRNHWRNPILFLQGGGSLYTGARVYVWHVTHGRTNAVASHDLFSLRQPVASLPSLHAEYRTSGVLIWLYAASSFTLTVEYSTYAARSRTLYYREGEMESDVDSSLAVLVREVSSQYYYLHSFSRHIATTSPRPGGRRRGMLRMVRFIVYGTNSTT